MSTTLALHLAYMMARLGRKVLAADLDPQANLTSAFFDEDRLEKFWEDDGGSTVLGGVLPILRGLGDIHIPEVLEVAEGLWVLPGDLGLSRFEDKLSEAWPHGYDGDEAALRVTTSFHRMLRGITEAVGAQVVIVDVGPNLGAINRAALLGADELTGPTRGGPVLTPRPAEPRTDDPFVAVELAAERIATSAESARRAVGRHAPNRLCCSPTCRSA